jgi:diguanylate cyclase (GGDEF)-like protein
VTGLDDAWRRRVAVRASLPVAVLAADRQGAVTHWDQEAEHLSGQASRDAVGTRFDDHFTGSTPRGGLPDVAWLAASGRTWTGEVDLLDAQGRKLPVWMRVTPTWTGDDVSGVIATLIPTSWFEYEEWLVRGALHDPLTGLANRALLLDHLGLALAELRRREGVVAVLFVDLDGFKQINDELGHVAGDEILVLAAGAIQHAVRPSDTVARIGGDEFVIVCGCIEGSEADAVARRVSTALASVDVPRLDQPLTASIGLSKADTPDIDPVTLISLADASMYDAKRRLAASERD